MTEKQISYAKQLRQQIMATFAKEGSIEHREGILLDWGYPSSLRECNINQLKQIRRKQQQKPKRTFSDAAIYNKQNKFIYSLMKQIGWEENQLALLIGRKFKVTHLNCLNDNQKRRVIAILKGYKKKQTTIGGN